MNMNRAHPQKRIVTALLAASLIGAPMMAHADEREDLEKLRATVLGLIDTLVKSGVIPAKKADAMMREAESRATARLAQMPPPEVGPDGKKIVRVGYVPEAVKTQMREQIKAEVLAETRAERQGGGDTTESGSRLVFDADVRLRAEMTRLKPANTAASAFGGLGTMTRAADVWGNISSNGIRTFNTQEDTNRERLRVRAGVTATISDTVTAGVGISTGSTTGSPTSTNQTMGNGFNKYSLALDRAYIKYAPERWLTLSGGRMRNPFVGTDLLWADDLSFEGFAMTLKPQLSPASSAFLTAGWFPISPSTPKQSHGRSLLGVQAGFDWQLGQKDNRVKMAAAFYDYRGMEGAAETQASYASAADYGLRSEYGSGYRQRGNTLFMLNAPNDTAGARYWGLASAFRELDLTASLDVAQFDPMHVILTGDMVKNLGFKRSEIAQRTGVAITDGRSYGYMGRVQVGAPQIVKRGEWNATLGYRYLGSDAVLDAFTNSDFGLGGTNSKGIILGVNYGIAKNTWLSARWLSSDLIDSMAPLTATSSVKTNFAVDLFQLDLNARY